MDTSAVKAWVDANVSQLHERLGLSDWRLVFHYVPLKDTVAGECSCDLKYKRAHIKLNAENIADLDELKDVVIHELLHIHHAAFDIVWDVAQPFLATDDRMDAFAAAWSYAMEMTVKSLENLVQSLEEDVNASHRDSPRKRNPKRG